jgi:hypothetical protein
LTLLLVGAHPLRLEAQSDRPRPAIVVVNLRFDGEHANVLSPGDTAVVAAATSKLLATLRASELVALVDATTGKPVLADSYEIKGDARTMAPAGAHVFAQRIEKTIRGAR